MLCAHTHHSIESNAELYTSTGGLPQNGYNEKVLLTKVIIFYVVQYILQLYLKLDYPKISLYQFLGMVCCSYKPP